MKKIICPECNGVGFNSQDYCQVCRGQKYISLKIKKVYDEKVPAAYWDEKRKIMIQPGWTDKDWIKYYKTQE